ncbi:MAG: hypothetical protein AB7V45_06140 [Candidatus Krumholzibacteriia bacterium]
MMRNVRIALGLAACVALAAFASGCSTAGPFVTNISSDGQGNIIVEKNMVKYNSFTGNVSTGENPTVQTIRVIPEKTQDDKGGK